MRALEQNHSTMLVEMKVIKCEKLRRNLPMTTKGDLNEY